MHLIWTLIIGFFIGVVAKFITPGNQKLGIIMTTVLGIIGAFVGTFIGQALGIYAEGEAAGFIFSVIGALIVLFVAKRLAK
jgi:uncharacterized membrane protein YeaQ/YmgE (transglycosylase-associated protein family)